MYEDIIQKASAEYGVSSKLITEVIRAESNFDANAVSGAGAQGLMQLMPATAQSLGVTDPFNPEQNIMGGTKYLAQALEANNNRVDLALAAYNAGQGAVDKYGGVPPYKETQNYVNKILSAMGIKEGDKVAYLPGTVDDSKSVYDAMHDTTWWGDIVIVAFTIIIIVLGIVFLIAAFSGGSVSDGVKNITKKVVKK